MSTDFTRPLIVRTFMTHDMRDEDIAAVSTGRVEEFRRIMDAVARSRKASPGSLQHVLLYGSRGFGKSFMARRAQIEAAKLSGALGPVAYVLLPEEQHNLQRTPHAFLDAIRLKLDEQRGGARDSFQDGMFQWPKPGQEGKRWDEAAARLEASAHAALPDGNGLVIAVVENFDTLLATLFKDEKDEQRLRQWLDRRKNRVMVFATATGTVDMDYDRPLFHAFEPVRLLPWSADDCIDYFNRHRTYERGAPLNAGQTAKARAIADFIGGTPRLAQLLADVLDTQDALSVADTMSALADRLAEYYRRRIEDLPPLGRGLLDALIRGGEPASQTLLAERVGADGQSDIARAMTDLQAADIVRGRPAPHSRETLYSVTDRVFVHYYRLRQGGRAARETPLSTILEFLRGFYSRDEQRMQALQYLEAGRPAEADLFSRLAMDGVELPVSGYTAGFASRLESYRLHAPNSLGMSAAACIALLNGKPAEAHDQFRTPSVSGSNGAAIAAAIRAQALVRMDLKDKARKELEQAFATSTTNAKARSIAGLELFVLLETAIADLTAAASVGQILRPILATTLPQPIAWHHLSGIAWALNSVGWHSEAVEASSQARQLAQQMNNPGAEAISLRQMALCLATLDDRRAEALETSCQAVELARKAGDKATEADSLERKAYSLQRLARYPEALETSDSAIALAREIGDKSAEASTLIVKGWALACLDRNDEAFDTAMGSIAIQQAAGDRTLFFGTAMLAVMAAMHVPRPQAITVFGQAVEARRTADSDGKHLDPTLWLNDMFIAAARARAFEDLDAMLVEHGDWLAENVNLSFTLKHGECLAKIANSEGRAVAYEALAGLLPRIAGFIAKLPTEGRDQNSLMSIVVGFTYCCRDPGLLRDVATLITGDPKAAFPIARFLRALAEIEEADSPETVLTRLDPDLATAIRRMRKLPDPPPVKPKRRAARRNKPRAG